MEGGDSGGPGPSRNYSLNSNGGPPVATGQGSSFPLFDDNSVSEGPLSPSNENNVSNPVTYFLDLLVEDGSVLTVGAAEALTKIFLHYDQDEDDALSKEELSKLFRELKHEELSDATARFLTHTYSTDKKGNLDIEGFLDFYFQQAYNNPVQVYQEIQAAGVEYSLLHPQMNAEPEENGSISPDHAAADPYYSEPVNRSLQYDEDSSVQSNGIPSPQNYAQSQNVHQSRDDRVQSANNTLQRLDPFFNQINHASPSPQSVASFGNLSSVTNMLGHAALSPEPEEGDESESHGEAEAEADLSVDHNDHNASRAASSSSSTDRNQTLNISVSLAPQPSPSHLDTADSSTTGFTASTPSPSASASGGAATQRVRIEPISFFVKRKPPKLALRYNLFRGDSLVECRVHEMELAWFSASTEPAAACQRLMREHKDYLQPSAAMTAQLTRLLGEIKQHLPKVVSQPIRIHSPPSTHTMYRELPASAHLNLQTNSTSLSVSPQPRGSVPSSNSQSNGYAPPNAAGPAPSAQYQPKPVQKTPFGHSPIAIGPSFPVASNSPSSSGGKPPPLPSIISPAEPMMRTLPSRH